VFGVFGHAEASNLAYLGITRSSTGAGVGPESPPGTWSQINLHKAMGSVADIFDQQAIAGLPELGDSGIPATRPPIQPGNAQPMVARTPEGVSRWRTTGTWSTPEELRAQLVARGGALPGHQRHRSDRAPAAHQREGSIEEPDPRRAPNVRGAYSLLFLTEKGIVAVRDRWASGRWSWAG